MVIFPLLAVPVMFYRVRIIHPLYALLCVLLFDLYDPLTLCGEIFPECFFTDVLFHLDITNAVLTVRETLVFAWLMLSCVSVIPLVGTVLLMVTESFC